MYSGSLRPYIQWRHSSGWLDVAETYWTIQATFSKSSRFVSKVNRNIRGDDQADGVCILLATAKDGIYQYYLTAADFRWRRLTICAKSTKKCFFGTAVCTGSKGDHTVRLALLYNSHWTSCGEEAETFRHLLSDCIALFRAKLRTLDKNPLDFLKRSPVAEWESWKSRSARFCSFSFVMKQLASDLGVNWFAISVEKSYGNDHFREPFYNWTTFGFSCCAFSAPLR